MLNIQTWSGSGSASITDMDNAGKRGKTCRVFQFRGWRNNGGTPEADRANEFTALVIGILVVEHDRPTLDFDGLHRLITSMVDTANREQPLAGGIAIYDETIRGVDAPVPVLTAGVAGLWSARADKDGLAITDDADKYNEPAMITTRQKHGQAYRLAAKVWTQVQGCATFSQVGDVLKVAGCKLHYYCRMD